jgi:hypothetical protein
MDDEGVDAPRPDVGSLIMLFEHQGHAEVLAPNDAERRMGNAVVRNINLG